MKKSRVDNVNIVSEEVLPPPCKIREKLPLAPDIEELVLDHRDTVREILERNDKRLLAVVGPCSIHDVDSAIEYASRLGALADEIKDSIFVIMRVYFEKPRTSVGWKGFINDPFLDDSFKVSEGLFLARQFLLKVAGMGIPAGTEALDPIVPQYIGDLITWTAIGARTTESQTHREMASGLSTPVGFKNGTEGNIDVAINALKSLSQPHHFLGISQEGQTSVFHTRGNTYGHIVLRGGLKPNYQASSVAYCEAELTANGQAGNIMIDCSHGNAMGNPANQGKVLEDIVRQILHGNKSIFGFMIESNLGGGKQAVVEDRDSMTRGVSVTDPCVDWPQTEDMLRSAADKLKDVLKSR